MEPAVRITGLSKSFGSTQALRDIDLEIREGEIFALMGRNGAGKTTLIKILATLYTPDSGQASVFGHDTVRNPRAIHPLISLSAGEEKGFYWRLSGRQNLEFFGALYNLTARQTRQKIVEVSSLLELEDLDKRYDLLSAGQKQRLSLARAFLQDSRLIFLDEPERSLDPLARRRFRALVRRLSRDFEKTFLIATHDVHEAGELADRIAVLDKGRIAACGNPGEIIETIFRRIEQEEFSDVL